MRVRGWVGTAAVGGVLLAASPGAAQVRERAPAPAPVATAAPPRLVPVAETRLLMDGVAKPNFDGLSKLLKAKPADADGWAFARGQGLLVAETANLLLIRPPKTKAGQDVWVPRAVEMRDAGVKVAQAAGAKDYLAARTALAELTNACNRCHTAFAVPVRLTPVEPE